MTNPGGTERWSAGDPVLLRFVRNRPADVIMPVTVVQDTDEYIALYTAVGTPIKVQAARDGTRLTRQTSFIEREGLRGGLADGMWTTNHVLMLQGPGRMSAIWLFWRDLDWTFTGYYANLQAPLKRTHLGFDTADYLIDVEISPGFTWAWKDEDEWETALDLGLVNRAVLIAARAEGERVIREVEERAWPFDAGLESWRPDPEWPVPEMPANCADGLIFPE